MKTTEAGGVSGYAAGKKIKGRKRQAVVDTTSMFFGFVVTCRNLSDGEINGVAGGTGVDDVRNAIDTQTW